MKFLLPQDVVVGRRKKEEAVLTLEGKTDQV